MNFSVYVFNMLSILIIFLSKIFYLQFIVTFSYFLVCNLLSSGIGKSAILNDMSIEKIIAFFFFG